MTAIAGLGRRRGCRNRWRRAQSSHPCSQQSNGTDDDDSSPPAHVVDQEASVPQRHGRTQDQSSDKGSQGFPSPLGRIDAGQYLHPLQVRSPQASPGQNAQEEGRKIVVGSQSKQQGTQSTGQARGDEQYPGTDPVADEPQQKRREDIAQLKASQDVAGLAVGQPPLVPHDG